MNVTCYHTQCHCYLLSYSSSSMSLICSINELAAAASREFSVTEAGSLSKGIGGFSQNFSFGGDFVLKQEADVV